MWNNCYYVAWGRDKEANRLLLVVLRVQNEQFSEEKGFILRYTEKEV